MTAFKDRLTYALELRQMKPVELSEKTGISRARISQYMSGTYTPKSKGTLAIANALNVSETWLMGLEVPMERQQTKPVDIFTYDNIKPIKLKKFPLLGEIACGEPIYADEDKESYIMADMDIEADFCLVTKGDSMINARIFNGDIVFIRKMPMVQNGDIAAIIINDEATLKRVYYYPEKNKLVLNPENPTFEPLVYIGDELNTVRILGKAVYFMSAL